MAYRSLDNILNDDSETTAEIRPATPETPQETGVTPQPEPEQGEDTAQTEGAPPAPAELPHDVYKPLKAVRDENKALKDQIEALRREVQQAAMPKEPPPPPPSIWEDEQGAFQHFGGQVVSRAVQEATLNARLDMSEMMVRQSNPDFEEVKAEFLRMAQDNPTIAQQALADPHPWQKAYQIAKNARTMQELGATDLQTLEAKIREQIMAEMQATPPAEAPRIPPSLSTTRSVSSRNGPAWSGPPALGDILR
jgi:cell division septum initiation protein DivIVA